MTEWWKRYTAWEQRVKEEFHEKYPDFSGRHVEICEDGSVYLGNLMWLPKESVTPWETSQATS